LSHRFETKFPLDREQWYAFHAWRRDWGGRFEKAFPDRIINNLYFESHDLEAVADNKAGISRRSKCRLRWYADTVRPTSCDFEIKHRRNATGSKQRRSIAVEPGWFQRLWSLPERLRPLLDPAMRVYLDAYRVPALFNRYRREYFSTPDGIRMTIDTQLRFADPSRGLLRDDRFAESAVSAVVELKYPLELRRIAVEYLSEFPVRPSRCSKYVLGIEHVYL